jgi:hypothetical protein
MMPSPIGLDLVEMLLPLDDVFADRDLDSVELDSPIQSPA